MVNWLAVADTMIVLLGEITYDCEKVVPQTAMNNTKKITRINDSVLSKVMFFLLLKGERIKILGLVSFMQDANGLAAPLNKLNLYKENCKRMLLCT